MQSTPEKSGEKLLLQHCRFPTSPQRHVENRFYDSITRFNDDIELAALVNSFERLNDLVLAAWAILLRFYIRTDTVTFVVLSGVETCCYQNKINDAPFNAELEALVLQFQFGDECRLKDVHAAAYWKCTKKSLEAIHINTAVNLLTSSTSIGTGHASLLQPFDLVLNLNANKPLDTSICYQWPTISEPYARAVTKTFQNIVNQLISNSGCKVGELDFISEEDKQKMASWNPKVPYAQMNCMHYLVEAIARAIPNSEAVCAWDGSLSYAQLDELSSTAAKLLIEVGVASGGMYVPFAFEKSVWTVVATLAILKAGGAFVPLDPLHPRARLEETLSNIRASVVVTSDSFASTFTGLVEHVVVFSAATISTCQDNELHRFTSVKTGPTDPIFVLFTSGSTGKPKGIVHEHGAICTHAIAHGEAMGYQGARVLQFAAHIWDVAIIDIFTTLIFGGVVCIPSEEDRRSNIVGAINSMKADYAILTPSFAGLIEPSEVPTLRTLAIGGEALPQDHVDRWAENVSLIQIYGPAEVGICLTMRMQPRQTRSETVGHTLRNSSCWLVDPDDPNRLVPIGAVGELAVAGPSLARGYLNEEAKTQSSFLENLSWTLDLGLKCQRFYLTGDLLRINTSSFDGSYDFVARKDCQIKLRGQRIEPGEVEHHITQVPGVATSVVARPKQGCYAGELVAVVQMFSTESNTLLALDEPIYLTPDQSLSVRSLRRHLSKNLPGYMMPTACLIIARMPLIPSLKIDRKRVDDWLVNMKSRPSTVAQSTALDLKASKLDAKEVTANILSSKVAELVAGNDVVKRQMLADHEFKLQQAGIDSIQIISLSMFLRKRYKVKVPMDVLLSSKVTIRDLAYLVDHRDQPSMVPEVPALIDVRYESYLLSEELFRSIGAQSSNSCSQRRVQTQNILLTGASGYLGSAILQHLVARPTVHVFALVRCSTELAGLQRITDAAARNGWWQDDFRSRIHVWPGDLTEPNLGLDSQQLQLLRGTGSQEAHCIHAIIHNGARVHYSSAYETLQPTNVTPTLALLQLAALSPALSTLVYVSGGQKPNSPTPGSDPIPTNPSPPRAPAPLSGYASSKAISEHIVHACASHPSFQHTRLCTIKPGYIIGAPPRGIAKPRDYVWRLVAACVELGAYNADDAARWLFVADASRVARAVVAGVFGSWASGHVERVLDGLRLAELWTMLRGEFGYALEPLGGEAWMERLRASVAEKEEGHGLFPLLHVLEGEGGTIGEEVEVEEGWGGEERVGLEWGGEVREAVRRNVGYLVRVGFLPKGACGGDGERGESAGDRVRTKDANMSIA